jgi:hypothetical protein
MMTILQMIKQYSPENVELEPKLQPFTPDYIPCIADIDPMIKVAMPTTIQGEPLKEGFETLKTLGLAMIDEPNSIQSDPAGIPSFM